MERGKLIVLSVLGLLIVLTLVSIIFGTMSYVVTKDGNVETSGGKFSSLVGKYVCVGSRPVSSVVCSGDDKELTENTQIVLVDNCSSEIKCEYLCPTGKQRFGYTCKNITIVDDGMIYQGDSNSSDNATVNQTNNNSSMNGVCGSLENVCVNGSLVNLEDNSTHKLWNCLGINGTNASCFVAKNTSLGNLVNITFIDGKYKSISLIDYSVVDYNSVNEIPGGVQNVSYKTDYLLMREIPLGTYQIGSPSDECGTIQNGVFSEAIENVRIDKIYYFGIYEVTRAQWIKVMDYDSSLYNSDLLQPMNNVAWNEIRGGKIGDEKSMLSHTLNLLSFKVVENAEKKYSFSATLARETGLHFNLPTEKLWEVMARAGTTTSFYDGSNLKKNDSSCLNSSHHCRESRSVYFWDSLCDRLNEIAWFAGNYYENNYSPAQVGLKKPNAWGFYDVLGSISELTDNALSSGVVARGGNFHLRAPEMRSSDRNGLDTVNTRSQWSGFRIFLRFDDSPISRVCEKEDSSVKMNLTSYGSCPAGYKLIEVYGLPVSSA